MQVIEIPGGVGIQQEVFVDEERHLGDLGGIAVRAAIAGRGLLGRWGTNLSVAALVVREDHALARVMQLSPVARIGKISYGLYIWHLCGLHVGNETVRVLGLDGWTGAWVAMGVYLAASVAMSAMSAMPPSQMTVVIRCIQ